MAPMSDPRAFATSLAATLATFAATFLLYSRTQGRAVAALSAAAVSVLFVATFGVKRARLGRPRSGTAGFREALYLGLTVAALGLLVGWFAFAR
jgi:hypothetical protein